MRAALILLPTAVLAYNNGMALTPPMGWNSVRFPLSGPCDKDGAQLLCSLGSVQCLTLPSALYAAIANTLSYPSVRSRTPLLRAVELLRGLGFRGRPADHGRLLRVLWPGCCRLVSGAARRSNPTVAPFFFTLFCPLHWPLCSTYIVSDDGWSKGRNATTGEILADPDKFPGGWPPLVQYIHSKGLKAGLYSAASSVVCSGRVGSLYNEYLDAKTFASWDIDYVKYECVLRGSRGARAPAHV